MNKPIIFLSYSHDHDAHRERVLALSTSLRQGGFDMRLDQYVNGTPAEGWPRWMLDQLDAAEYVLVICTETYYRRFRGHEEPGKGKGVDWEGALITNELYLKRSKTVKFVPVLFSPDDQQFIPEPLLGLTHYQPTSQAGYDALYDFLLNQAGIEPGAIGEPTRKPRATGKPLEFADETNAQQSAIRNPQSAIKITLPPPLTPHLFGRDDELRLLDDAWVSPSTNIVVFHALGGAGKSALVSKWLAQMLAKTAKKNYDGARRVFGWSFFSQGSSENRSDSSEAFIDSALAFFGVTVEGDYFRKADRLAEALRAERTVLILDGLEPLQYPPNTAGLPEGGLKDRALQTILLQLAAQQPGLCIITSRERLSDLNGYDEATVIQRALDHLPYTTATGEQPCAQLLRALGATGDDEEMLQAAREFQGHAYGLTLLGSYVAEVFGGDLRRRKDIANLFDDDRFGSQADRMIAAYETWLGNGVEVAILRLLGLFDRPAEAASIAALRAAPAIAGLTETLQGLSEVKWQQALARLRRLNLLSSANPHAPGELDAHPLVREHFRQQLKTHAPDAWRAGNLRLYEHLTRTAKDLPDTLEEMTPLFAAVTHGCEAGHHQETFTEVFRRRIQRGDEFFSTGQLGTFGADLAALTNFFVQPWAQPVINLTHSDKAFVLGEAGYCLRPLGRLKEAAEPLELGLVAHKLLKNWDRATVCAGHLSQLYLITGELRKSIDYATQSESLADSSHSFYWRPKQKATLARALHQAGYLDKAEAKFREAEKMQNVIQPQFPTLYSLWGFMYCDLLLDQGRYQEVQSRTRQSLGRRPAEDRLLWIALDQLLLGRAYSLQTQKERTGEFTQATKDLNQAVDMLRQSGRLDYLPYSLLARAACARIAGQYDRAARDLAEARSIAARGEMRLHLCDYHLEAARLHLAQGHPDEARTAWATARDEVDAMGYHRRDAEVAEIESQLKSLGAE